MILCPRCLKKIDKDRHDVADGYVCRNCRQRLDNTTAVSTILFPDCITKITYVGLNTWENAREILKMMQ
jgi:hypothetical protein